MPLAVAVLGLLVAYAGFAVSPGGVVALAGWFILAGAATGAIETAEHAGVARAAPHEVRASAFGYLAATRSGGRLVASVAAGVLWTLVAPAAGLLWAAPLILASAALLILAARE